MIEKLLGVVVHLTGLALLIGLLYLVYQSAVVADQVSRERDHPRDDTQ